MAKKKSKTPRKAKKARSKKPAGGHKARQNLQTPFMAAFTAEFIRAKGAKSFSWPADGQLDPAIAIDFATFVDVLMNVGFLKQPKTPDGSGSLRDRLMTFLNNQGWPESTAIPPSFRKMTPTVHLVEIAVLLDRLLEAVNARGEGAGGGPSSWPPH